MKRNQRFQKIPWVCFPKAEDEGHMLSVRYPKEHSYQTVCPHPWFRATSLARLRVSKGNMCYVPGSLCWSRALPQLAQIDVWSIYLDPLFAIYSKGRLETCKYSTNLLPWERHWNPKKLKIATIYILWKYHILCQLLKILNQILTAVWKICIIICIWRKWKQVQRDVPQDHRAEKREGRDSNPHLIHSRSPFHHPELLPNLSKSFCSSSNTVIFYQRHPSK